MRAKDYVLSSLAAEGVSHVFLVPGQQESASLPASGVTPIVAVHEAGAAFMADGYARASGRFGVCLTGPGPGVTNLVTAAATARADASPILFLTTASPEETAARDADREMTPVAASDVLLLAPVTVASFAAEAVETLPQRLRLALTRMLAGAGGPVHMRLGAGLGEAAVTVPWQRLDEGLYQPRYVDEAAVERLWRILVPGEGVGGPTRVAVLAGAGVEKSGAGAVLTAFAEQFDIPVATTLRAKGVFPEDHRLSLGVFGCDPRSLAGRVLLSGMVEVLIVLGGGLSRRDTFGWDQRLRPTTALVHVDLDPAVIGRTFHTDVPIVGDCRAALSRMLEGGSARVMRFRAGNTERQGWLRGLRRGEAGRTARDGVAFVVERLRAALPRDGAVVVDSGSHQYGFASHFKVFEPRTAFAAAGRAPLGWAVAAAIGVKAARPERAVACLVGGGCMLAHGLEVATAARYGLGIVYLVLAAEKTEADLGLPPGHDFAALGRALGARGLTVSRPEDLDAALDEAFSGSGPCLVQVAFQV